MEITQLVDRCRGGDGLAWEMLVRKTHGRVFAVAYHYMRDADEAREMTQDVFVRIYEKLGTFDADDRFLPWLISIARNACIDRLRRIKARPPASDVRVEDGPPLRSSGPGPEETTEREQRKRLLYRAMEQMSERSREILLLKEIQGLKVEEIARLLTLPVGTIKSRASRARLELASRVRALDASYGA